jgi:ribonuclease G
MQITRQRVRPNMDINTMEDCPNCYGNGQIKPSILFTDSLERKIDYLVNKVKIKKFKLHVHPFLAAFINKGIYSLKWKWRCSYSFGLKIISDQSLAYLEYRFIDSDKNEIDLKEEIEIK